MQIETTMQRKQYTKIEADSRIWKPYTKVCIKNSVCSKTRDAWCASQAKLRWMANQLLSIQENERKRIAMDLHDGLGQSLTMIKFALANAKSQLDTGSITEVAELLQKLKFSIHDAIEEVRQVSKELCPPMLDQLGILATLSCFTRELEATCPSMKVEKDFGIVESGVPVPLKITIYRIIQEASSNIVKHANASRIKLSLHKAGDVLRLTIEDNGNGFDPASVSIRRGSERGLGLLSMKERAGLSGGVYVMDSVAGQGTCISVSWQLGHVAEVLPSPNFGIALD